jgi:hypothetical protein
VRRRRSIATEVIAPSRQAVITKLAALLLLTLSVLLYVGARLFLAGIASYQADAFISEWERAGLEPQPRAWQVAHDAAQRAISLNPVADGQQFDRLGRIHSWKQFRQPYADVTAHGSRLAALEAYRTAVALRPNWPYSWARLAHSKRYLQQFDDEFDQALTQAFQLGPWRIGVTRELAQIGFSAWAQLNERQRQATLESARRSVSHSSGEAQRLFKVALDTGTAQELCTHLSQELKAIRKICI